MKIIFTLAIAIISTTLFFSVSSGVTTGQSVDRTGSPFSTNNCNQCHSGSGGTTTVSALLKDAQGNTVTEYEPGQSYTYEVTMQSGLSNFGIQAVSLLTSDDSQAGTLAAGSSNTKTATLSGRTYIDHNGGASSTNVFEADWTAPSSGSGSVRFYVVGMGVNANGGTTGDDEVGNNILSVDEMQPSSISDENENTVNIYPNPASDYILVETTGNKTDLQVYSVTGKVVANLTNVLEVTQVNVNDWKEGIYFISLESENHTSVNKIMVKH